MAFAKRDGRWPWNSIDRATLDNIRTFLSNLESMTWGEILQKKHNHWLKVESLCKEARDELVARKLHEHDMVMSLADGNKPRVVGIMRGFVMHVLWWDPEHEICPSVKKHT